MKKKVVILSAIISGLAVLPLSNLTAQDENDSISDADLAADSTGGPPPVNQADDDGDDEVDSLRSGEVEYTVSELQQLVNFPSTDMNKEYQEDLDNPELIFDQDDNLSRIFGDTPDFVYYPEGQDPMIIPWVREKVIAEELFDEAMVAKANRDFDKAKAILRQIQEQYPQTNQGTRAPDEISKINQTLAAEEAGRLAQERAEQEKNEVEEVPTRTLDLPDAPQEQEVVLPAWVRDNTTGVLVKENGAGIVVIHDDFVEEGQTIKRYPSVRVSEVSSSSVTYTYQDKQFRIRVDGAF